jgi:hypothetical protein
MVTEHLTPEARLLLAMREENTGAPEKIAAVIADRARLAQATAQLQAETEDAEMRRR